MLITIEENTTIAIISTDHFRSATDDIYWNYSFNSLSFLRYSLLKISAIQISSLFIGIFYPPSKLQDLPSSQYRSLMVVKPNECHAKEMMLENNPPSVNRDHDICPLMNYNGRSIVLKHSFRYLMIIIVEADVQQMFTEDEMIENSACTLSDSISDLFHQLCSFKDNLIAAIPSQ